MEPQGVIVLDDTWGQPGQTVARVKRNLIPAVLSYQNAPMAT